MEPLEPVALDAGHFRLRPATEADVEFALRMSQDPEIAQWYSIRVDDPVAAWQWLQRGNDWSDGHHATWVVADPDNRLVGNVSLVSIDREDQRSAMIAYRTAPWAKGAGVATNACATAARWAFEVLSLERLELCHAVANAASCRVAEKTGFLIEGTQRLGFRDDSGRRWDAHLHARLAEDPDPLR